MKTNLFKKLTLAGAVMSTTALTFAQQVINLPTVPNGSVSNQGQVGQQLSNIVLTFKNLATGVYSAIFIVAFIVFFGVIIFKFLIKNDPASRQEGIKYLGFGILALFVMFGVMGLIAWISTNLGVGLGGELPTPSLPSSVRTY